MALRSNRRSTSYRRTLRRVTGSFRPLPCDLSPLNSKTTLPLCLSQYSWSTIQVDLCKSAKFFSSLLLLDAKWSAIKNHPSTRVHRPAEIFQLATECTGRFNTVRKFALTGLFLLVIYSLEALCAQ